jgi:uncharacterized protein
MIEFKPWFEQGVRFTCTECGQCCTGAPGVVRVDENNIREIAAWRGNNLTYFRRTYVRKTDEGLSLTEKENGDCIFFKNNRCSIYPVRPGQCRTYPFWFRNMRSPEAWKETARECPGIGQGEYFDAEEIIRRIHASLEQV